jgi:hypothetical protein
MSKNDEQEICVPGRTNFTKCSLIVTVGRLNRAVTSNIEKTARYLAFNHLPVRNVLFQLPNLPGPQEREKMTLAKPRYRLKKAHHHRPIPNPLQGSAADAVARGQVKFERGSKC